MSAFDPIARSVTLACMALGLVAATPAKSTGASASSASTGPVVPAPGPATGPGAAPGPIALGAARSAAPPRPVATPLIASGEAPAAKRRRVVRARSYRVPLATIARANAQARDWPSQSAYVNSALYYDFEPGRLYTIHTSPRFLTTITLKPGEKLISKAAGDTVRWVLGETQAGAGDSAQVVIFVKPIRPDLRTNIILTTDQRTYLIDAVSTASTAYTSVLSWNYPQDLARQAAAERQRQQVQAASQAAPRVADAIAIDQLNFRYRIEARKGRPRWAPVRVFDDGVRTFIEFPADLATTEAPPLFLLGSGDQAELVNYRQRGVYYVVDRLVDRAELRLGSKPQAIVRLTRLGVAR